MSACEEGHCLIAEARGPIYECGGKCAYKEDEMIEHYQIVQMQSDAWHIFDNWKSEWIPADFNSKGAALAYIESRHPNADIDTKEA